jgi:hypothetical protein
MEDAKILGAVEDLKNEIEEHGIFVFYSDYGKHAVTIKVRGDSTIYEVGEAFKAFLLASGFTESLVAEILE